MKLLITCLALIIIISNVDWLYFFSIIQQINYFYLLVAWILYHLSKWCAAFRFGIYATEKGYHLRFFENLKINYIGMFYNIFLPGGIGGDGYKALLLKKRFDAPMKSVLSIIVMDRISGFFAILMLVIVFFYLSMFFDIIPLWLQPWWFETFLIIIGFLIFKFLHFWLLPLNFVSLLNVLISSLLAQFIQVVAVWLILSGLNHMDGWYTYSFVFLLSSIISLLPISIGGFGTREVTFLTLMPLVGESVTHGVIIAMVFYWIQVSANFVGAFLKSSDTIKVSSKEDCIPLNHNA